MASVLAADEFAVNEAGASKKATAAQIKTFVGLVVAALGADVSNSTTVLAKVTGLDTAVGIGTWAFKYLILHQSAATTTGIRFSVNHTGTVTSFVANMSWVAVTSSDATAAQSQAEVLTTGAPVRAFSARAKSTAGWSTTISVDAANSDLLMVIEGLMVVTVSGNIELWSASEVAAQTTVKANSSLILTQIA